MLYHTLEGDVTLEDVRNEVNLYTALNVDLRTSGETLVDAEGKTASIIESDVRCSNGFLQFIDGVLRPPDMMTSLGDYNGPNGTYSGAFDTILEAINVTNETEALSGFNGPFTVSFLLLQLMGRLIGFRTRCLCVGGAAKFVLGR